MGRKVLGTWVWAAVALVVIQLLVLAGLLNFRQQEMDDSHEWSLDPKAVAAEAVQERESREALKNLPVPQGTVRLSVSAAQAAAPQAEDLLEQARDLQNRGQFELAEKILGQALGKDPANPRIRVASALLAEARQDSSTALQRWRDLIRMSEEGGSIRRLALARSRVMEERVRLEQVSKAREENLAKSPRKLALAGVEEKNNEAGGRAVSWRVRAVGGTVNLDPRQVQVRVVFFERGPEGVLKKSDPVLPRWEQGPPRSEKDGVRTVMAEIRPVAGSSYAGYSWQLFYQGELQDERIQPSSLRGVLREIPRS
ncbi:MAG: hypothetical protein EB056_01410 [Verrucomicrobia bacterium]|nr:hypothetical protein [Verrucomicrobiota bacterium]